MFTSGPWIAQRDIRAAAFRGKPGWNPDNPEHCAWAVYGPSNRIVLFEDPMPWNTPEMIEGNAKLVAAAPSLLEACQAAMGALKVLSPACHDGVLGDKLRAAIASAD